LGGGVWAFWEVVFGHLGRERWTLSTSKVGKNIGFQNKLVVDCGISSKKSQGFIENHFEPGHSHINFASEKTKKIKTKNRAL